MMPVHRVTDVEIDGEVVGDVLIADSDALLSRMEFPNDEHELPYFWRTGYAIDRPGDKTWLAGFCDYPPDAFLDYGGESRQRARLDDCLDNAVQMMRQTHEVGLYRGNDRKLN